MEAYEKIKTLVTGVYTLDGNEYNLEDDVSKFYEKGNKAAGTRVRKLMQELKKLAQDLRVDVQNQKNN
jgi:hypothetical protein